MSGPQHVVVLGRRYVGLPNSVRAVQAVLPDRFGRIRVTRVQDLVHDVPAGCLLASPIDTAVS
jgi:hypothetical protein